MIYVIEAPTLRGPFMRRRDAVFSGHVMVTNFDETRPGAILITYKVTTIPRRSGVAT